MGPENRQTLLAMMLLASIYGLQSKYGLAEPLLIQVEDIQRRNLGDNSTDALNTTTTLPEMYQVQGKVARAAAGIVIKLGR